MSQHFLLDTHVLLRSICRKFHHDNHLNQSGDDTRLAPRNRLTAPDQTISSHPTGVGLSFRLLPALGTADDRAHAVSGQDDRPEVWTLPGPVAEKIRLRRNEFLPNAGAAAGMARGPVDVAEKRAPGLVWPSTGAWMFRTHGCVARRNALPLPCSRAERLSTGPAWPEHGRLWGLGRLTQGLREPAFFVGCEPYPHPWNPFPQTLS